MSAEAVAASTGGEVSAEAEVAAARQAFLDEERYWLDQQIFVRDLPGSDKATVRLTGVDRGVVTGAWGGNLREYEVDHTAYIRRGDVSDDTPNALHLEGDRLWMVRSQRVLDERQVRKSKVPLMPPPPQPRLINVRLAAGEPPRVRILEDGWRCYRDPTKLQPEEAQAIGLVCAQHARIQALSAVYGGDLASLQNDLIARYAPYDTQETAKVAARHAIIELMEHIHNDQDGLQREQTLWRYLAGRAAGGMAVANAV
jgi:hypothetical protein